jgi:hypothetical protein
LPEIPEGIENWKSGVLRNRYGITDATTLILYRLAEDYLPHIHSASFCEKSLPRADHGYLEPTKFTVAGLATFITNLWNMGKCPEEIKRTVTSEKDTLSTNLLAKIRRCLVDNPGKVCHADKTPSGKWILELRKRGERPLLQNLPRPDTDQSRSSSEELNARLPSIKSSSTENTANE